MEETDRHQKSAHNAALAVASLTSFVVTFALTSLNVAIPRIGVEFKASTTSIAWIALSFLLVTALLSVPFGRIADIHGRRPLLNTGILLFGIASFLNIFAPSLGVFLVLRVIQGVGGAMIFATNTALLAYVYPSEKRGKALGFALACAYLGSASGPVIGGLLTHSFGWHSVFIVTSSLTLIAFIIAMQNSPKEEFLTKDKKRIDAFSIALFIISFGLLLYGIVTLAQNIQSYFILAAGAALVVFYIRHETKAESPVLAIGLFRGNPIFGLSVLAIVLNHAAVYAVTYLMSIYLQLGMGFAANAAGLIMISQPVVQAILSPVAGRLSDKKSPSAIAAAGMAFCAGALLLFAFLNERSSLGFITAGMLLVGIGSAFFVSPTSNIIFGSTPGEDYGVAASMIGTARTFGQVISMGVMTIITQFVVGNIPIAEVAPSAIVSNVRISFAVFAAICLVGVFFSFKKR